MNRSVANVICSSPNEMRPNEKKAKFIVCQTTKSNVINIYLVVKLKTVYIGPLFITLFSSLHGVMLLPFSQWLSISKVKKRQFDWPNDDYWSWSWMLLFYMFVRRESKAHFRLKKRSVRIKDFIENFKVWKGNVKLLTKRRISQKHYYQQLRSYHPWIFHYQFKESFSHKQRAHVRKH